MSTGELAYASVSEIARRVSTGDVSAREVAEAFMARISDLDRSLNSFITVLADQALEQAAHLDAARRGGAPLGPLAGVPIAVKDLIDVAGVATTGGGHPRFSRTARADAPLVARIRAAGGIIVGKTNLHEFAYGVTNVNCHHGATRNPWALDRIPGGSSGGSAAAVAVGMCAVAVGTDTGGSVRIPAALCGVVGLKPTRGAVPLEGVFPLARSFDHAGPITRSVADAELLFRVMAGLQGPYVAARARGAHGAAGTGALARIRVGVPRPFFWEELADEVRGPAEQALEVLRSLGASVRDVEVPWAAHAGAASALILGVEATTVHADGLRDHPEAFGDEVRARLDRGFFIPGAALLRAQRAHAFLVRTFEAAFETVDVLVTPATIAPAATLAEAERAAAGQTASMSLSLTRLTNPFNVSGQPAISVPCGLTDESLPVGLQIVGRRGDEDGVLRVAAAYETASEWHRLRPPLASFAPAARVAGKTAQE
jgi:Asp-tRNA(Asn)/Glu-tRNA(Gln) amidotransferase A subunit family amidase